MSSLPAPADINRFALLLDIDGTLLDIAATPREVFVSHELRETLKQLSLRTDGAVAFVSGRPLPEIDLLFAPLRFPAVAGHGAELRRCGEAESISLDAQPLAPEVKGRFATIADLGPGVLLEDKGYSLAVHFRLAPQQARAVRQRADAILASLPGAGIELLPGKMMLEIKRSGFTKATGVRELICTPPFAGRRPIYLGDDVTDWAVFAMLPAIGGIGVSVGADIKGASCRFEAPEDVRKWLYQLAQPDTKTPT